MVPLQLYYNNPQNLVVIIKAPTLHAFTKLGTDARFAKKDSAVVTEVAKDASRRGKHSRQRGQDRAGLMMKPKKTHTKASAFPAWIKVQVMRLP